MTQPRLSGKWTERMEPSEASKFKDALFADRYILGRLYAILEEFEESLDNGDLSIDEYNSPSFPYLKADRNGERRGIRKVKQLLSFLKD